MSSLWSYSFCKSWRRVGLSPFTAFYYIVSVVLYIIALPLLIVLSLKSKYRQSIPSRFFLFNNSQFENENGIWFHVCSLGEARALKPILNLLQNRDIKITAITHTGHSQAKRYNRDVKYLPYEIFLPFWMKKQKLLIILEAEFWYMLIIMAHIQGTKVILLNARISERSEKKYLKLKWFYKKMLQNVEIIYAQSQEDKKRFLALGATNIEVIGNIKLADEIKVTQQYEKQNCEVVVAGSTHRDEEESILEAFVKYNQAKNSKLIVVPRHPERFEEVYKLMESYAKKYQLSLERFSQTQEFKSDLILVDRMGELNNIYAISDIAILGGAFREDVGGHNPLEPAEFRCKIITGNYFFHQKELFKYVQNVQYVASDEIYEALKKTEEIPPSIVNEKIDLQPVIDKILKI
ncbi:MAG: lipid IV(A) 3-deoxy-D-manno-octulosonic acid transferase [Campylobacterota bacterium]|nr:lipid IV(A) 3-deoxy-D-manno-octulosonic acid transferase [Campylobacterota bacterium]